MSRLGEYILTKFSRDINSEDYKDSEYEAVHNDVSKYSRNLERTFPDMRKLVTGKRVLDIGCSWGLETIAIFLLGAAEVNGIDIRINTLKNSEIIDRYPAAKIDFKIMDATKMAYPDEYFDAVVTCESMEHFQDPYLVLKESLRVLKKGGVIFVSSSVWSHPWGAHMQFFTRLPWVQFLFSEKTIMNVRRRYRNDGAKKFTEVSGGLNKIGITEFKKVIKDLDLTTVYIKLNPVKKLTFLIKIPLINELFTNLFIAIVKK